MFEWNAVFLLLLLGWVFLPVYISSGIYTIPEYLHVRFGGQRLRIYLSIIAILTYLFAILSVDLYSGALFIRETLGLNIYIGVAILLGTTILFTTLGGLLTVVFTDAFAVVVMVIGGFVLFIVGIIRVGGMAQLQELYMKSIPNETYPNSTCGYPRDDAWHIFRNSWTADFPAVGTFLRTSFMGSLWYWCCNQVLVQRSLAAKNIVHAKAGSILASYLKLTPLLIMVLPGMMARALFPNEVGCATPESCEEVCGNPAGCSNIAYPRLAIELLPNGLRGLLIAAMIAAVISSLTSVFNSSSSIVTLDLWRRIRPRASERELLIVGKVFLVALTGISVVWIPIMESAEGGQIYKYSVAANGLFGGPTCSLFIIAVSWKRINEKGAFWGLMAGQAWGLLRFILDAIYPVPHCIEEDNRPFIVRSWHVYYHVCSQVVLTAVVAAVISYLTKPPPPAMLAGTTFWTRYDRRDIISSQSKNTDEKHTLSEMQDLNKNNPDKSDPNTSECSISTQEGNAFKRFVTKTKNIFCTGNMEQLSGIVNTDESASHPDSLTSRLVSLKQSNRATILLNINAVIVVVVTIALYIYFG